MTAELEWIWTKIRLCQMFGGFDWRTPDGLSYLELQAIFGALAAQHDTSPDWDWFGNKPMVQKLVM